MNVNTEIWGEPLAEYWGYNERTGAADLTDPDFDTYEPFIRNNINPDYVDPVGQTFTYSLRAAYYKENSPFEFNVDYPDYSVAYIGVQNPDMPQCNVECYGPADDSPAGDTKGVPCFKTDPNGVATIAFVSNRPMRSYRNVLQYAIPTNEFQNITFKNSQGVPTNGIWCLSPYYRDVTNAWVNRNHALDCAYWRSLGLRTFFGVIYVNYCDATVNSHNIPTKYDYNPVTLHWYESQSAEWREAHPIYQAYLKMCIRHNTSGLYNFTHNPGDGIMPDLTYNLKINPNYVTFLEPDVKLLSPSTMFGDSNNFTEWPLFGRNKRDTLIGQWPSAPSTGGMPSGTYPMFVGANKGQQHKGTGSTTYERQMYITYDDDDYEWFRKGAAAYGVFFTDGDSNDEGYADLFAAGNDTYRWVNDKMCLGIVDDNGYTHGEYTRGMANPTAPNWGWANTTQSPYDPSRPPPSQPMSYDSTTTFNDISNIATLTRRYALTKQNVEDLGSELWQISSDIINNIQNDEWYKYTADVMDTFLVTDPLSCIVSLQKYPMTIPEQSGPVHIKLGKAETSISANITKATAKTYYFTPIEIKPRFGNSFMDYEPYTHFELYVPFCGTTELDPRDILGCTLSVNLVVDFNTGTCVAYVLSDSLVIETINGSLAIDIPVTGVDSTTIASNITQGIINTRNARYTHQFGTLGKLASPSGILSNISNVWGSAQSILTSENNAKVSEYELTHQPAQPHVIGSASPVGSWAIDFKCRLLIYYPTGGIVDESKVADSSQPIAFDSTVFEQYLTQIGFATVDPVSALGEHYAHTLVCAEKAILNNVTTPNGRPATEPELQLIRQALQEGVILP